ncbi:GNAT family N-acetyltransferase [Saccharospirillum salsuginis]|uniref:N-acetyltransferase domain-containing protein n=1 Tax=Saccharospirillum salsuginis TaxID=418750 RepID=A0A918KC41_9GAMM|nr:GNAT family N-acetyltransferase [Saccharospirillum salsuginis]GGX58119.1 hypothetical protein GCM10007392_27340 [Saccharospirillum salsuginis]
MSQYSVRHAKPGELSALIAIDDAASRLYETVGITFDMADDHPFVVAESERWARAIEQGAAFVAVESGESPVGFIALKRVDNEPYLDQLSVHPDHMRQGLGARLLSQAIQWSGDHPLWLTTYAHVQWNKPFYERYGFYQVPANLCGPELLAILDGQRVALPEPDQRIAMVRT